MEDQEQGLGLDRDRSAVAAQLEQTLVELEVAAKSVDALFDPVFPRAGPWAGVY
jgi:hypothetical protein